MNPANRVRELFEFQPKRPKTGWRIWRSDNPAFAYVELWIEDNLIIEAMCKTSYDTRKFIWTTMKNMDEETKREIRIAECFNEAADYEGEEKS